MAGRFQKSHSRRAAPYKLPAAFRTRFPGDTEEIELLWQKLFRTGDKSAYDQLFVHYLPVCQIVVFRLMRSKPDFYSRHEFDEMISDACAGLMFAIESNRPGWIRTFWSWAQKKIHRSVFRGAVERKFGTSHRYGVDRICRRIRERLTQQNGQAPTQDQVIAELAPLIHNPQFWSDPPKQVSLKSRDARRASAHSDPLDQALVDSDTLALAGKDLSPEDRKLVEMALKGHAPHEIAAACHLHPNVVRRRVNGALWALRANADLREYLDAADAQPAESKKWDWTYGRAPWRNKQTATPAADAVRKIA